MKKTITIITGGQTVGDLAALDAALALNIPCGGWCPRGRISEDGRIGDHYPLIELPVDHVEVIERNVIGSDGTLVFAQGKPDNSAARAIEYALTHGRPHLAIDTEELSAIEAAAIAVVFMQTHSINRLNVAAGRKKSHQSLPGFVRDTIDRVLKNFISFPEN